MALQNPFVMLHLSGHKAKGLGLQQGVFPPSILKEKKLSSFKKIYLNVFDPKNEGKLIKVVILFYIE